MMLIFILVAPLVNYLGVLWFEHMDEKGFGLLDLSEAVDLQFRLGESSDDRVHTIWYRITSPF